MNCSVAKQLESQVKLLSDRIGKLECGLASCNAKASSIMVTPAPSAATPKEPVKADTADEDDDDDVDLFGVCCNHCLSLNCGIIGYFLPEQMISLHFMRSLFFDWLIMNF